MTTSPIPTAGTGFGWHVRRTLELALPIILARMAFLIMYVVDSVMTGWTGAAELAYLGLGLSSQLVLMMIGLGAIQSVSILIAQFTGAGELAACGKVFRAGLFCACVFGLLIAGLSLFAEDFYLLTGQQADLARGGGEVAMRFGWGMPGLLMFVAANYTLEATNRPRVGMLIMIVVNLLNVPLNAVFAVGWGGFVEPMGAAGAVMTSSILYWFALAAICVYIVRDLRRSRDPYAIATGRPLRTACAEAIGPTGRRMMWIGLPMGLAQGVESAAFATLTLIAGHLGTTGLATHHITMTLTSLIFMMAIGMMSATAIRVGNAVGRGDQPGLVMAGWTGIILGGVVALIPTALYLGFPGHIAGFFTQNGEVIAFAETTIRIAGVLLAFDAMMGVSIGALRGTGDVWPAFFFQAASFWLLAIPLAWLLAIEWQMGPAGLVTSIFAGVLLSLAMLVTRFLAISRRPIARI